METIFYGICKSSKFSYTASFIGSGINGNNALYAALSDGLNERTASFIGGGINGDLLL
jgi:hypothetical protein